MQEGVVIVTKLLYTTVLSKPSMYQKGNTIDMAYTLQEVVVIVTKLSCTTV